MGLHEFEVEQASNTKCQIIEDCDSNLKSQNSSGDKNKVPYNDENKTKEILEALIIKKDRIQVIFLYFFNIFNSYEPLEHHLNQNTFE